MLSTGITHAVRVPLYLITFDDLEDVIDKTKIGLKGSPTRVKKSYAPDITKVGVTFEDMEAEEAATKLMEALIDQKLI